MLFRSVRATAGNDDLTVRFRSDIDSNFVTKRSAGAVPGFGPKHGDIARAFTHVGDWRSRLRKGMDIEILVQNRGNYYYCAKKDTILHYVRDTGQGTGDGASARWWLSRRKWNRKTAVETNYKTVRGYLKSGVCPESDHPPASVLQGERGPPGSKWELWNGEWSVSPMVQITVEINEDNLPVVTVTTDPDLPNYRNLSDEQWPGLLAGVYVHAPEHVWQKRRIAERSEEHTSELQSHV